MTTAHATDTPRPRTAGELLLDRAFGPYVVGNLVSSTGNWFQNVAAAFVVFQLTGSSTLVGVVGVLQFGATLVPALVPRVDLPQAIALGSVSFNLARAIGPGLAGLALATTAAIGMRTSRHLDPPQAVEGGG